MIINFKGAKTYIGTGGKSLDINKMTLCFLHGSGHCLLYTSDAADE